MEQVRPLVLTIHHSSNPESSIPAERRLGVHQVPLDPDDDRKQLLVLALAVELELLFVADALPETVICPKISDKKIMNAISRQWPGMNIYTAQRWVGSSSPPCTAVSC